MKNIFRSFLLVVSIISITNTSLAQWVQTNGPTGGDYFSLAAFPNGSGGSNILAGSYVDGIYLSTDYGTTWTNVSSGTTWGGIMSFLVCPDSAGSYTIFAGTEGGYVFRSTDNGLSWISAMSGITNSVVMALASSPNAQGGRNIYAGTIDGLFRSTDDGTTWSESDLGLTNKYVLTIAVVSNESGGTILFAGTTGGMYRSTDEGTTWETTPLNKWTWSCAVSPNVSGGTNIFAGTDAGEGAYISTDNGSSWDPINSGLTNGTIRSLCASPNTSGGATLFAGTSGGLFVSRNRGTSWSHHETDLPDISIVSLASAPDGSGGMITFAGTQGAGVFRTSNNGTTWTTVNKGLAYIDIRALTFIPAIGTPGGSLFAGAENGGMYRSTDDGNSWTDINHGLGNFYIRGLAVIGRELYAGTTGGVWRSTDDGSSWNVTGWPDEFIETLIATGDTLYGGNGNGDKRSTDHGVTWTKINDDPSSYLSLSGSNIATACWDGRVFLSTDAGFTWTEVDSGLAPGLPFRQVTSIAVFPNGDGGSDLLVPIWQNGLYLSTDLGLSWTNINPGLSDVINVYTSPGDRTSGSGIMNIYAGTQHRGVFLSSDNGVSWTNIGTGLETSTVGELIICPSSDGLDSNIFIGAYGTGVWKLPYPEMTRDSALSLSKVSGSRAVMLHWSEDGHSNFIRYRIFGDTASQERTLIDSTSGGVTETTKVITGLANGTTYHFRLASVNSSGFENNYSNKVIAQTGISNSKPHLAVIPGNSQAFLHWSKVNYLEFMRYLIYADTLPHPITLIDSTNGGVFDTTKVISGLTNGKTYYFRIAAVDSTGIQVDSSNEIAAAPAIAVLILNDRWNLVSLPVTLANYSKTALFPSAISSAFAFEGIYKAKDTLVNDVAYWLKFSGSQYLSMNGTLRTQDTINIQEGWNMIGSISTPIPANSIVSIPGGLVTSQLFGYNHGYSILDTVVPGKGYWLKASQPGQLILSSTGPANLTNKANVMRRLLNDTPPPPPETELGAVLSIPTEFALLQNYPNPFNPTITITYSLPTDSRVTLRIYNTLGKVVAILVDEQQHAGYRSASWTAAGVASGVYFCRLDAVSVSDPSRSFSGVKKMILLK